MSDVDLAPFETRARDDWPTSGDVSRLVAEVRKARAERDAAHARGYQDGLLSILRHLDTLHPPDGGDSP